MPILVVFPDGLEVSIDTETMARLGRLGITQVTLFEGATSAGALIQGWAFDEEVSGAEAVDLLAPGQSVRVCRPVMQLAVNPRADVEEGGEYEETSR